MTLIIALSILLPALAWKSAQVRRDPANLEAWAVLVAIACLAIALLLNVPRERGINNRLLQLGENVAVVAAFGALQLFYLNFVAEYLRRPRLRLEVVILIVTLGALGVLTLYENAIDSSLLPLPGTLSQHIVTAFYTVGGGYIIYALGTQLWWTVRYARRLCNIVLRAAVIFIAIGALILLTASILRVALVLETAVWGGSFSLARQLIVLDLIRLGTPILVAGLIFPLIVWRAGSVWLWWCEFRAYRQLRFLWRAVRWVYPEIIRPVAPINKQPTVPGDSQRRSAEGRKISSMGFAFQGRLAQCWDGYLRVHGSLDANTISGTEERVRRFITELRACPRVPFDELTVNDPGTKASSRWDPDVHHLITVSRTLRKRGMAWCRDDRPLDETADDSPNSSRPPTIKRPNVDTLVSADLLLTGQPGAQIIDGAVLVRDNRIDAVGPRQQVLSQTDEHHTDLAHPGCTLLPGLINTHVHLVFDASPDPIAAYQASVPEILLPAMAERARQCLVTVSK